MAWWKPLGKAALPSHGVNMLSFTYLLSNQKEKHGNMADMAGHVPQGEEHA